MHIIFEKLSAFFNWLQQTGEDQRKRFLSRGTRDRKDEDVSGVD